MSGVYEQALTHTSESSQLKEQQRRWLRDTRTQCSDTTCLKSVYLQLIAQLSGPPTWMTNEKEQEICKAVVDAVNDGTIGKRIKPFESASEDDKRVWAENRSRFSSLYLHQTLKITAHGKSITLGMVRAAALAVIVI